MDRRSTPRGALLDTRTKTIPVEEDKVFLLRDLLQKEATLFILLHNIDLVTPSPPTRYMPL
jgi:hypothetical protein